MGRPAFSSFESIPKSGLAGSHGKGLSILRPNWNRLPALSGHLPAALLSLVLPHLPPARVHPLLAPLQSHLPPPVTAGGLSPPDSRPSCPPVTPPGWSPPSWGSTCTARTPRSAPARVSHGPRNPTCSTLGSTDLQAPASPVGPPAPSQPASRLGVTRDLPCSPTPTSPSLKYPSTHPPLSSSLSGPPNLPTPDFIKSQLASLEVLTSVHTL